MTIPRRPPSEIAQLHPANWEALPVPFYGMLAATMGIGMWTGLVADSLYLWTTPTITVGLLVAAQLRIRRQSLDPNTRNAVFPRRVEREILSAFACLSEGNARRLLSRLIGIAEPLYRKPEGTLAMVTRQDLAELIEASCHAALDLDAVATSADNLQSRDEIALAKRIQIRIEDNFRRGIAVLRRAG